LLTVTTYTYGKPVNIKSKANARVIEPGIVVSALPTVLANVGQPTRERGCGMQTAKPASLPATQIAPKGRFFR
jgi:hypothetical protein